MTINPVTIWASSYETIWEKVFKDARGEGFDTNSTITKSWQKWNNDNAKGIQCIAPLAAPVTISGSTKEPAFTPVDFSAAKAPPQVAQVLATAWQTWATSILWTVVPPAPPFSAIITVLTDPASIAAAYSTLYSALITIMSGPPVDTKTAATNLGNAFFTAAMGLKVQFSGIALAGSPPPPLIILVPVF